MSELVKIFLGALSAVGAGLPVQGQAGVPTVTCTVTGVGAVSATVVIRGSNDGVAWVPLTTINVSGTNAAAQMGTWTGDYAQLRADATALAAGATVSTSVSVDQTGSVGGTSGVSRDVTRYKAQRLAHKADAAKAATSQATPWSAGMTLQPWQQIRLGDGSGAAATASLTSNAVSSIAVTAGGSGYTKVPVVSLIGGGGTGAQATAVLTNGVVTSINVTNGGSGYSTAPTVSIAGSNGALVLATQGTAGVTGSVEPVIAVGAAPAAITDGTVTLWPLQEQTRPVPAGIPVPVITDNAGASARTQYGINANPGLFEQASAPNVFVIAGSGNTARTIGWTVNDGSSTDFGAGAGRITPYRTVSCVVADDVIEIGYFATTSTYINERPIIEVGGYPAMEVPLIPAAFGGSRHLKMAIPGGRRERLIRIRCSGGFNLQYLATASDIAPMRPPVRALTAVVPSDSFGNTEMPNAAEDHLNLSVRVTRRLGFPNCVMAVVGGTAYSFDDAGSGRQSLKKIMAANDFGAFGADLFMPMHSYNAAVSGVAPAVECDAALTCWQGMRQAASSAPIIPISLHYLRPGFVTQCTAMRDALKAQFLAWADSNSAFVDPTDGSITLGDGTVVRAADSAWINATNASWVLPPSGGVFDGAHLSIAGRAFYEDKLVAAVELALAALGR